MKIASLVVIAVAALPGCFKQPHWVAADISESDGLAPDSRTADGAGDLGSPDGGTKDHVGGTDSDAMAGVDIVSDCLPECGGDQCGPDGCGGSCGECVGPEKCIEGKCESPPFHMWSYEWGGWKSDYVSSMAAAKDGGFVLAGYFESETLVLAEDVVLKNKGYQDIFIVALDSAGVVQWGKAYGAAVQDVANDVGVATDGSIFMVGNSESATVNVGGQDFVNPGKYFSFIAKYLPDGQHVWSTGFGAPAQFSAGSIALKEDHAWAAGGFTGDQFKLGELSVTGDCAGEQCWNGYIAAFDALGSPDALWLLGRGCYPAHLAVLPGGDFLVAGSATDSCQPMGQPVLTGKGAYDVFVARIDGGGGLVWAKSFGGENNDGVEALDVSPEGEVVIAGTFEGPAIDFGGPVLKNSGENDAFVAKLTSDGEHVFSASYGTEGHEHAYAVAAGGDGSVYVGGQFGGAGLDFGGGTLIPIGETDAYVVRLDPKGTFLWAVRYGGSGDEFISQLTLTSGSFVMAGAFGSPTISFGGESLRHESASGGGVGWAMFVAGMTD